LGSVVNQNQSQPTEGHVRYYLSTLAYSIAPAAFLQDARLCALAAEDAAWCATLADWRRRAPRRWRWRAQRRWSAEYDELVAAREQVRELARSLGLPVAAGR
jgi:hypothetical protein